MKKLLSSIFAVLFALSALPAFSQTPGIQNEALKTLANTAGTRTAIATDKQGRILLNSVANGIFSEDSASASGDKGQATVGINNRGNVAQNTTQGDYTMPSYGDYGEQSISMIPGQQTSGDSAIRAEDAAFTNAQGVVMQGFVNNRGLAATYNSTAGDVTPGSVGDKGVLATMLTYDSSMAGAVSPMVPEDSNVPDLQTLLVGGGVNNRSFAAFNSTNGDATPFMVGDKGVQAAMLMYDSSLGGGSSAVALEDDVAANAQAGVVGLAKILAVPVAQAGDGDNTVPLTNDLSAQYTDGVRRGTFTHSNPSVGNASSVTLLASNAARRYLLIQNNSAANVCINLNNATLTGIVPSNTNPCIVLAAGAFYESPPNAAPTAAVTIYQTSGGAITTITTVEAS